MSKVLILRCLVNERLTAAVEEIFALFERTIAEYEEELCRSKDENQRKQQILDSVLRPQAKTRSEGVQVDLVGQEELGPSLSQENTETAPIKEEPEEQSIKQEEEQLQEFTAVSVKSDETLLQQRQSEHREETQADLDYIFDPFQQYYSDKDIIEDEEPPCSSSTQQMETEADGGDYTQAQMKNKRAAAKISSQFTKSKRIAAKTRNALRNIDSSGSDAEEKTNQAECPVCKRTLSHKWDLRVHMRVHTGEKPYSCSVCQKCFTQSCNLRTHMKTHSGEKPFCCSVCNKCFLLKAHLNTHMRTHTGEKPYSCTVCGLSFMHSSTLNVHIKKHTIKH